MSEPAATAAPPDAESTTGFDGARVVPGIVVIGLGLLWAWRRLRDTYYHFDEWSMIGLILERNPVEGAIIPFNGHLYLFQDLIYRTQALVFGLSGNGLVVAMFMVSLAVRHAVVAALAERLGMGRWNALLIGGLLTYPGVASETFLFSWQVSTSFAAASALGIGLVVLDRAPTTRRVAAVGLLVVATVLLDSGIGLLALAFGGSSVLVCWPRRTWPALAPGAFLFVALWLFADRGQSFPGSIGDRIEVVGRLLLRSAGGLVGQGAVVGALVLAVGIALIATTWRSGLLGRSSVAVTVGGGLAALVVAASIAQSRAGIPNLNFFNFNRYLHNVGLPLALALLPATIAAARWVATRRLWEWHPGARSVLVGVLIIAAWAGSLDEEGEYGDLLIGWNQTVEAEVQSTVAILNAGCPDDTVLIATARPVAVSPQIRVTLVEQLLDRAIIVDQELAPDPLVVSRVCLPTSTD